MESFFTRYRNLVVLLAVLLAQIIGLAVQVRRPDSGRNSLDPKDAAGVRLIRMWADMVVTPPEQIFHASKLGAASLWQNYLDLRHVREQNQDLQKTIDRLRLEQASSAVVFDDVDVDSTATQLAAAVTMNTGQVCCARRSGGGSLCSTSRPTPAACASARPTSCPAWWQTSTANW
jgi:hypothetical protein